MSPAPIPCRRPRRHALGLVATLASLLLASCGGDFRDFRVSPWESDVRLDFDIERRREGDADVIVGTARVVNEGLIPVRYLIACGAPGSFRIDVQGPGLPERFRLCFECPGAACPACAPMPDRLEAGKALTYEWRFTGDFQDCSDAFTVPSGRFTVTATFVANDGHTNQRTLTKAHSFDWTAPAP